MTGMECEEFTVEVFNGTNSVSYHLEFPQTPTIAQLSLNAIAGGNALIAFTEISYFDENDLLQTEMLPPIDQWTATRLIGKEGMISIDFALIAYSSAASAFVNLFFWADATIPS